MSIFIFGLLVGAFVAFVIAAKRPDISEWVYDNTFGRLSKKELQ